VVVDGGNPDAGAVKAPLDEHDGWRLEDGALENGLRFVARGTGRGTL
jgi:hypothetical protein